MAELLLCPAPVSCGTRQSALAVSVVVRRVTWNVDAVKGGGAFSAAVWVLHGALPLRHAALALLYP